jgi:hypothetical protein
MTVIMPHLHSFAQLLRSENREVTLSEVCHGLIYALQLIEVARSRSPVDDELAARIDPHGPVVGHGHRVDDAEAAGRGAIDAARLGQAMAVFIDFAQPLHVLLGSAMIHDILAALHVAEADHETVTLIAQHVDASFRVSAANDQAAHSGIHQHAEHEQRKQCIGGEFSQEKAGRFAETKDSRPDMLIGRRGFFSGGYTGRRWIRTFVNFIHNSPETAARQE